MKKNTPLIRKKEKLFVSRVKLDGITPFTQQPSGNKFGEKQASGSRLKAADLFSRFTADIIKKDVPFTR